MLSCLVNAQLSYSGCNVARTITETCQIVLVIIELYVGHWR